MILGIGFDGVEIHRIQRLLSKWGEVFKVRVFTESERVKADASSSPCHSYAKRFAAKEAFVKSLHSHGDGISWQDIGVVNLSSGAPVFDLRGKALDALKKRHPQAQALLSLSDTRTLAQAVVILCIPVFNEAIPNHREKAGNL